MHLLGMYEMDAIEAINIKEKLTKFTDHWNPRIIAALNGQLVKLAKLQGEFEWHAHDNEDELFFVLSGQLKMELEGVPSVEAGPGEIIVVPKGVRHKPVAEQEVEVLLFEPEATLNTGDTSSERTRHELEWI